MTIYLLMKHPPYPYNAQVHMKAGEVVAISKNRSELLRAADEKNSRNPRYLYLVHRKIVKGQP